MAPLHAGLPRDACIDGCTSGAYKIISFQWNVMRMAPHDPVAAQMAQFYPWLQFYTRKQWFLLQNAWFSNEFEAPKSENAQSPLRVRPVGTSLFLSNC